MASAGSTRARRRARRRALATTIAMAAPAASTSAAAAASATTHPAERQQPVAPAASRGRRVDAHLGACRRAPGRRGLARCRARVTSAAVAGVSGAVSPLGAGVGASRERAPAREVARGGGLEPGPADAAEPDLGPGVGVVGRDPVDVGLLVERRRACSRPRRAPAGRPRGPWRRSCRRTARRSRSALQERAGSRSGSAPSGPSVERRASTGSPARGRGRTFSSACARSYGSRRCRRRSLGLLAHVGGEVVGQLGVAGELRRRRRSPSPRARRR